jgi:hypothetical protein
MFLVNYSKDILYLVLAVCVLWLTFFLTWLIYHLVAAARQLHQAAQLIKKQVEEVAGVVKKIKLAIELPTSIFNLIVEGLKKIAEMGAGATAKKKDQPKSGKKKNGFNKPKNKTRNEFIL